MQCPRVGRIRTREYAEDHRHRKSEGRGREKLLRLIAEKHLSVRQTENLVASWATNEPARVPPLPDRELSRLQESLRAHLGARVLLKRRGERGTITIPFPSQSELERILAILGMN